MYTGHVDEDIFLYKKLYIEKYDNFFAPVMIFSGVTVMNNPDPNAEIRYIPGQTFLGPAACNYYHAIVDVLSHYETLKIKYPELNIRFFSKDAMEQYNVHMSKPTGYVRDIHSLYPTPSILDLQKNNYYFEEVISFPTLSMWHMDRIIPLSVQSIIPGLGHHELFKDRPRMLQNFKNVMIPKLTHSKKKKIYSARVPLDLLGTSKLGSVKQERFYPDEGKIIEYFLSNGYEIRNLSGMGLVEQLELFYNAESIAGILGTNIFNAFVAPTGTKVVSIRNQNYWHYQFDEYSHFFGHDYIDIGKDHNDIPDTDPKAFIPFERIIEELKYSL